MFDDAYNYIMLAMRNPQRVRLYVILTKEKKNNLLLNKRKHKKKKKRLKLHERVHQENIKPV